MAAAENPRAADLILKTVRRPGAHAVAAADGRHGTARVELECAGLRRRRLGLQPAAGSGVEPGAPGVGEGPRGSRPPRSAHRTPALRRSGNSSSHAEVSHPRLLRQGRRSSFQPLVKPGQHQFAHRHRGVLAEVAVSAGRPADGVPPRAHDQPVRAPLRARKVSEMVEHARCEVIVPAADEQRGHVLHPAPSAGNVERGIVPVAVEQRVIEKILVDACVRGKRRKHAGALARGKPQPCFRIGQDGAERLLRLGVRVRGGAGLRRPDDPDAPRGIHRAARVGVLAIEVRTAHVREHRLQVRRAFHRGAVLVPRQVGCAKRAHLAVRPFLGGGPFDGVVAVGPLLRERVKRTLRAKTAANVLGDHGVAMRGQPLGVSAQARFVVRSPRNQGGIAAAGGVRGQIQIAGQPRAVAHGDHHVAADFRRGRLPAHRRARRDCPEHCGAHRKNECLGLAPRHETQRTRTAHSGVTRAVDSECRLVSSDWNQQRQRLDSSGAPWRLAAPGAGLGQRLPRLTQRGSFLFRIRLSAQFDLSSRRS